MSCKPEFWFYYSDANNDDLHMFVRELKDPNFCPLAHVVSRVGFVTDSTILRRFLRLLGITNLPVADGYRDPISGRGNLEQGLLNYDVPGVPFTIQQLGDTLWGTADKYLPPASEAVPLSPFPSWVLLRKAILAALRSGNKFGIRVTGPATDLALDLRANEDLPLNKAISEIRFLAGSIDIAGNLFTLPSNKYGDFNIYLDPQAFVDVLSIAQTHEIPVTMISHDATGMCPITREFFESSLTESSWQTTEGKVFGAFFDQVRRIFGDAVFFNDANVPGGGFFLWDAHTSYPDEITQWECNYYNVETTPLIERSGWIFRTSACKGYPIKVGMALDCAKFQRRWRETLNSPQAYPFLLCHTTCPRNIESEPLYVEPCPCDDQEFFDKSHPRVIDGQLALTQACLDEIKETKEETLTKEQLAKYKDRCNFNEYESQQYKPRTACDRCSYQRKCRCHRKD